MPKRNPAEAGSLYTDLFLVHLWGNPGWCCAHTDCRRAVVQCTRQFAATSSHWARTRNPPGGESLIQNPLTAWPSAKSGSSGSCWLNPEDRRLPSGVAVGVTEIVDTVRQIFADADLHQLGVSDFVHDFRRMAESL